MADQDWQIERGADAWPDSHPNFVYDFSDKSDEDARHFKWVLLGERFAVVSDRSYHAVVLEHMGADEAERGSAVLGTLEVRDEQRRVVFSEYGGARDDPSAVVQARVRAAVVDWLGEGCPLVDEARP